MDGTLTTSVGGAPRYVFIGFTPPGHDQRISVRISDHGTERVGYGNNGTWDCLFPACEKAACLGAKLHGNFRVISDGSDGGKARVECTLFYGDKFGFAEAKDDSLFRAGCKAFIDALNSLFV